MIQPSSKSLGILLALGISLCNQFVSSEQSFPTDLLASTQSASQMQSKLLDRCCQVGKERAIESPKFNCKLSASEALLGAQQQQHSSGGRSGQLLALGAESLLARDANFGDQCEMVLESCCIAHHRTRNCDSGRQFARSGSACMDVELSKEATIATESFNDCCMSCSLGILAAKNPGPNEMANTSAAIAAAAGSSRLADRCKLISPLASSLSGQLYEQTYVECCQENLPRPSSALLETGAPIDCVQANSCSQRCVQAGSFDAFTRRRIEQDRCECFAGYKLAQDGTTCLDVDECKLNLHTCNRNSEICDNTRGSFRCLARQTSSQTQNLPRLNANRPLSPFSVLGRREDQESNNGDNENKQHQSAGAISSIDESDSLVARSLQLEPFASMRLCPPNSQWSATENRCLNRLEHRSQAQLYAASSLRRVLSSGD